MVRKIGGVIAGMIIAIIFVQAAEMIVHQMHPFPPGMDEKNFADIKKFVATLPIDAFLLVLLGWLIGTVVGTSTAARVGRSRVPAYVVGAMLLAAGIANAIIIPQPIWFSIVSVLIYIGGAMLGARLGTLRHELQAAA